MDTPLARSLVVFFSEPRCLCGTWRFRGEPKGLHFVGRHPFSGAGTGGEVGFQVHFAAGAPVRL